MRFLSFIVAAYLAAISVPAVIATAHAASTSVYANEAGWEVAINDKGNCVMTKFFDAGTKFVIGYDRSIGGFWFGFGRADWAPLVINNGNYTIDMQTDAGGGWTGTFTGYVNGNHGAYLSNGTLNKNFVVSLARSNWITFYNHDTHQMFRRLTLVGTYDGLTQMFACQEQQGWQPRSPNAGNPNVYTQ